jgi:hypothetical protein
VTTPRQAHRTTLVGLSMVMAALGVVLVVQALIGGGGVLSARLLIGAIFMVGGVARAWVLTRRGRG